MRILIKGGVWKNTEDEILKAAVMKYGKNQWSRISSLLVRKSAKQCKARWHEWLDPSIKKTEWSRDEEEKLLHLAKLMPTQWRTIAPIVGRTAAQCLEHYERLLDQATRRGDAGDASATDDPRRLRPGEIDPNPEAKPARPDPVDMDEDEKEMLSEARARLANTRGKKAKRKAREKSLEESRRLAALQKRRELKAAGIELASRSRKVRGVDYNTEIPFQKVAPAGYFDTTGEDAAAEAAAGREDGGFKSTLKSKLDAPNRDAAEAKARKADAEKLKRRREEALPDVIAQINKQSDLEAMRKRGRLMLPPPQVTDRELDAVVKASAAAAATEGGGSAATRALTANYDETPFTGAMRTPRAGGGGGGSDAVLEEAAAQAAMISADTPLMGGESAPISSLGDFSGATPRHNARQTPNPLVLSATPSGAAASASGTPLWNGSAVSKQNAAGQTSVARAGGYTPARSEASFSVVGSEFGRTPSRDAFGINESESDFGAGLPAAAAKRLAKQRREALAAQLGALPAPTNEYTIVMPDLEPEPAEGDTGEGLYPEGYVEDALDAHEREDAQVRLKRRLDLHCPIGPWPRLSSPTPQPPCFPAPLFPPLAAPRCRCDLSARSVRPCNAHSAAGLTRHHLAPGPPPE
jgi:pre-mRNA-splicing factor CDC5/CEF1